MDLSTCPTAPAPEPRASRPSLAGLRARWARRLVTPQAPATERSTTLAPGQALRIQARAGQLLRVRSGRIWATLSGWPEDRWLDGGQCWVIPAGGRLVIECGDGDVALVQW